MLVRRATVWLMTLALVYAPASAASVRVLHSFPKNPNSGGNLSYSGLVLKDGVLFGSTFNGGTAPNGSEARGTLFRVATDGSGFQFMHSFVGGIEGSTDGAAAGQPLLLDGNTLYGTTGGGGSGKRPQGTLFSIHTDGGSYRKIRTFRGAPHEGTGSRCRLAQCGSVLYGASVLGGNRNLGAVFSVHTNGSRYRVLHSFAGGVDGAGPQADLLRIGSTLYGTTGGSSKPESYGNIYSIRIDGSRFTVLYNFTNAAKDGCNPWGMTSIGSTLYGVCNNPNPPTPDGHPAVWAIDTNGDNFRHIHEFGAGPNSGVPSGDLAAVGNTLYGVAGGGQHSKGCVYSLQADGSGYQVLYSFTGGANDGAYPNGGVVVDRSTIYGWTNGGGAHGAGTVYAIDLSPQAGSNP